ncbi:MAG: C-terminal binding protein [Anaerolineae bacterium]|nr:C-terminal binding protein [Anaerolineae bacterium]
MRKKVVVHTGARPGAPLKEEREALDAPDIEFILRGHCGTPEKVLEAVRDADVALCYGEPYTREVFANAPLLKAVIRYGIGVDTVDVEAATEYGVMVINFPDFCVDEVANHALALMLACARKLLLYDHTMRKRGWRASKEVRSPMGTIYGETLGLIAFGNIARALARRAQALDMRVIAYDPFVEERVFRDAGVERVTSLEELAERSDYISCHVPLTPQTRGMLDASFFTKMKPTAYFINTSRGLVVKEQDLITALREGWIAGAGLDVFAEEPLPEGHPFLEMDNVILTPHLASYADETFARLYRRVGKAALAIARGEVPTDVANVANPEVLSHRRK